MPLPIAAEAAQVHMKKKQKKNEEAESKRKKKLYECFKRQTSKKSYKITWAWLGKENIKKNNRGDINGLMANIQECYIEQVLEAAT